MKLKQNTNLLQVGNKFLNNDSKKLVYYAHIYSHIVYGILVWGNMIENTRRNKLQKCMDDCFKLITYQPPTPLNYKKEKMLRLDDLIVLDNTKLSYKLQHNLLPLKLHEMLVSDSKRQSAQTKQYHSSYLFQSLKDFESTCPEIRNSNPLSTFTFRMKKKLLKE